MEEITSPPLGYKTCPVKVERDLLPYDSVRSRIESQKLLKFFGKKSYRVGLCIHETEGYAPFAYLSKALKIQQENKEAVFFPCITSHRILLEAIKAFCFFIPAPNVFQHFFTIAPNAFYTDLTPEEKIVSDIKILNSMDEVLISNGHPYESLIDRPMLKAKADEAFTFDLSEQQCI